MDFIDVYYSPKQVSCPDSSSPSPRKPALVMADWRGRRKKNGQHFFKFRGMTIGALWNSVRVNERLECVFALAA